MHAITLKPKRERSVLRRHPWIFSGAIQRVEGSPGPGETVQVRSADGAVLALGAYSPASQISVRVWSFDPQAEIGPAFFRSQLERAVQARADLLRREDLTALRLVYAESDGLPGLIVDRYAGFLVCQFLSAGAQHWKADIVAELSRLVPAAGLYERSDVESRQKEGLPPAAGVLCGDAPPRPLEIVEGPCRFLVDVVEGQKTGFYLDQRDNRARVAACAAGADVLNGFAYTGAFGIAALQGGAASATHVEASAAALELAHRNAELNGLDSARIESIPGDVFTVLRGFRDRGRQFSLVVLDPPKFADSAGHLMKAARAYKDINLLAVKLLKPGGLLFTFSCSGVLGAELFQKMVADAALDARRDVQLIRRLGQAADHPTLLSFPEGTYLKGLVCRVF
jgi:23S rRNA (cytosine1962-C5)-methyltransferase